MPNILETHTTLRPPYLSLGLLSASALAYEILLVRLFAISQWHHFAYMVISLALLGYGVSGTLVTLTQRWFNRRFTAVFPTQALLFALTALLGYMLAQRLAFNLEELVWSTAQWWRLLASYLLLAIPFMFAANAVALALQHYRERVGSVYAADLVGAGLGSLGVVAALHWVLPHVALQVIALAAASAGALACRSVKSSRRFTLAVLSAFSALLVPAILGISAPEPSSYKPLAQLLEVRGTRVVATRSSPLGLVQVVESSSIPLRHAPGLSVLATAEPPRQLAMFTDADAMSVITAYDGDNAPLVYLDQLTSALPYHLTTPQRVAVLGAGGGSEVLQARYHGVPRVEAVELNPQIVALVRDEYADFAGPVYGGPQTQVHIAEARDFVARDHSGFDLIQLAGVDAFGAAAAGLHALSESYLYTVEAFQLYLRQLHPQGMLAITRWVKLPPRDTLKVFATAVEALRENGVAEPGEHLVLIRGWQTSTLLVSSAPLKPSDIDAVRRFCRQRAFDVAYVPGIDIGDVNRFNVLPQPEFYLGSRALLGSGAEAFMEDYGFDVRPATDDRPYFYHFLKWRTLRQALALAGQGGSALLEWGYLIVLVTLAQALVVGTVLILLPLLLRGGWWAGRRSPVRLSVVLLYFTSIGLGFLFIEMAFLQRAIQLVHHPTYAAASTFAAFLLFAGAGSLCSARLCAMRPPGVVVLVATAAIALLGTLALSGFALLAEALAGSGLATRIAAAVTLMAPLAFVMGIPFPAAMARLGVEASAVMPWAWGVNGCASVLSAVLASLLAVHFGFQWVVSIAAGLYLVAGVSFVCCWESRQPDKEEAAVAASREGK
ncbi:MAG: hypothetical protein AMJ69_02040 [Gammaproteobacteria bacterium SG8_47]|nr:MAG: hypothetical protein AMJ69_02040 [Gammaproteobacteria bacterium SG8_47]